MEYLLLGFVTGLSLILAIGAQNIFVMGMLGLLFDITLRKIIDKTIPWRGKG